MEENEKNTETAELTSGTKPPVLSDEEIRANAIYTLPWQSDLGLRQNRNTCNEGGMDDVIAAIEAEGTPMPSADVYCRAILNEESNRAILNRRWSREELDAMVAAARAQETSFVNEDGEREALTCPLAYDIGYMGGDEITGPASVQPGISDAQIDQIRATCFSPAGNIHPTLGFVAGIRDAMEDNRLDVADASEAPSQSGLVKQAGTAVEGRQ